MRASIELEGEYGVTNNRWRGEVCVCLILRARSI
jgi:hypothetical protein